MAGIDRVGPAGDEPAASWTDDEGRPIGGMQLREDDGALRDRMREAMARLAGAVQIPQAMLLGGSLLGEMIDGHALSMADAHRRMREEMISSYAARYWQHTGARQPSPFPWPHVFTSLEQLAVNAEVMAGCNASGAAAPAARWFVAGETAAGTIRLHVLGRRLKPAGLAHVRRHIEDKVLPSFFAAGSLEMGVDPQCVEHDDCAESRELGEACWRSRRAR